MGNVSGSVLDGNRIEVCSKASGMYVLKYEGADGQVLPDYASVCTLTMNGVSYYDDFIDVNIAPEVACALGVYDYF